MTSLETLGWNQFFEAQRDQKTDTGLAPVRIIEEQRDSYRAMGEGGVYFARLEFEGRVTSRRIAVVR